MMLWDQVWHTHTHTHIDAHKQKKGLQGALAADALPSLWKQFGPQNYVVVGLVPWSIFSVYIGFG